MNYFYTALQIELKLRVKNKWFSDKIMAANNFVCETPILISVLKKQIVPQFGREIYTAEKRNGAPCQIMCIKLSSSKGLILFILQGTIFLLPIFKKCNKFSKAYKIYERKQKDLKKCVPQQTLQII